MLNEPPPATSPVVLDRAALAQDLKRWGQDLGFAQVGISGIDLATAEERLLAWLAAGHHGDMHYMARHGTLRSRPADLLPGTLTVISTRTDYLPESQAAMTAALQRPDQAYVARYALGRDYHRLLRRRLQRLALRLAEATGPFGWRVFVDSAPVMEKPLAVQAGLGWIGKHTNLVHPRSGSWFFLGEIYTDLDLPLDAPGADHCGRCSACISACPTRAIIAPYQLDARLCIAYLTIEYQGSIPVALRPLIGNRIYGCDDCQLVCPWNRFARLADEADFRPRAGLDSATLVELFAWDEAAFLAHTEGSPIRRIGHVCWLRNIAVALGNGPADASAVAALNARSDHPDALVREHVAWALARLAASPGGPS